MSNATPILLDPLTDARIAEMNREAQDQAISGIAPSLYLARAVEREVRAALEQPQPASALQPSLEEQVAYWRRQWESATDQVNELFEKLRAALEQPQAQPVDNIRIDFEFDDEELSLVLYGSRRDLWLLKAHLEGLYARTGQPSATGAPSEPDELRRAVRAMTAMLVNGEWSEHVSSDPDAQAMESAITALHSDYGDAYDTLTEAGWRRDNGEWALAGATGAQAQDVERDAARYRWLRAHTTATRCGGSAGFVLPSPTPIGNPMQGAVCQHLDDAIDAEIQAAAPGGAGERG